MSEGAVFNLARAAIVRGEGLIVGPLDWRLRDRAVTVLVGPVATGKSTLLRALARVPLPLGFATRGAWQYRGARLDQPADDVAFACQVPSSLHPLPVAQELRRAGWRGAARSGARVLLLDEPTADANEQDARELAEALRAHKRDGAALVVTHDLAFARAIADEVTMLCRRRIVASCGAEEFFERPPHPMVEQLLRSGTCWPSEPDALLPSHFRWLVESELAGMGRPGLLGDVDADLVALEAAGVSLLVSLTEEAFPASHSAEYGIQSLHFPIDDMGAPELEPTKRLVEQIESAIQRGERVVVHCLAGLGRTGTILASVLIARGYDATSALAELRSRAPGYVQSEEQARFLRDFERLR